MIRRVALTELPNDLKIPAEYEGRFWYDAEQKCLAFDGVMYKSTFDRLHALSHDFKYQRALEDLFRQAVPDSPAAGGHAGTKLVVIIVLLLFGAMSIGSICWYCGIFGGAS